MPANRIKKTKVFERNFACQIMDKKNAIRQRVESRTQGSRPRPRTQKKFPRPRTAFPRIDTLEAKAKDTSASASPKKKGLHKNFSGDLQKKKRSSQKFFKRSPRKNVFQKIFQALHKILTFQKILLSSSRGQANFRGLEASRPRPRT